MDATQFLERQHRDVEKLFSRLEKDKVSGEAKQQSLDELSRKLLAHMIIEQALLYPYLDQLDELLVNESYEEHLGARAALRRVNQVELSDETFKAKLVTLKEMIQHHVKEEEEELFPKMRKHFKKAQLAELGDQLMQTFEKLVVEDQATLVEKAEKCDQLRDAKELLQEEDRKPSKNRPQEMANETSVSV